MKAHDLARELLTRPNGNILISIDTSTCDEDAGDRTFSTEYFGWQEEGRGGKDTMLLFGGYENRNMGKKK